MKIVVIGATGTIGSAVAAALEKNHEVVRASRSGPVRVDMDDPASIEALFTAVSGIDAVVCCAASGKLTPLDSDDDYTQGLQGKLFGQLHLVRQAIGRLRDGGSITLTSGVFERPTPGSSFGALVNAGLDAFVGAAAIEMPRGLRVNTVCPGWVAETLEAMGLDGAEGTPAADVALAYTEAVEGDAQGRTLRPARRRRPGVPVGGSVS
ncbi:short chain dehydrogenase [Streptomyces aureoverticillatus]|uniref:short chain dehydrogenase n=1 Tax=Streptomyces aureoverticillatus TaxID=66871 RepID=UPI0013DA68EA|nr:short chain dehydrogenase [Streptomyces aureoverticillatus]QIB44243.1 short chain dehydrogenase [Streptomyces aureoverticillatus]